MDGALLFFIEFIEFLGKVSDTCENVLALIILQDSNKSVNNQLWDGAVCFIKYFPCRDAARRAQ